MDLHEQGMSSRTFVIAAIVCVLLQAGLAPQISIAGGRVNFMIILVCLSVFSGAPTRAVVCGFCSGLFYDLSAAVPVGVMSLLLTVGSFALVHSAVGQTGGTPSARGVTVGAFALVINVIYSIVLLFMGLETSFVVAIFGHALPSSILTGLLFVCVFLVDDLAAGLFHQNSRWSFDIYCIITYRFYRMCRHRH